MSANWKKFVVAGIVIISLPFIPISNFPSNQLDVKDKARLYNPHDKEFIAEYVQYLEQLLQETHTPGAAIAIVKDSSILFTKGLGFKSSTCHEAVDGNTIFRIASLSKGFAAVLSGELVEDSLFNWNDSVQKYLPEFSLKSEACSHQLEIKNLLSHTTGLPRHSFTNLIERGDSLQNMVDDLKDVDLIAKPGEIYSYQNVAFSIIGEIIEATTHEKYKSLLQDKIFDPLGMNNASVSYDGIMSAENVAIPHGYGRHSWVPVDISDKYYNAAPAGGINASASDMAEWLKFLIGERPDLINPKTLKHLYEPAIKTHIKYRYYRQWDNVQDTYYGLGWRIVVTDQDTLIHHGGYVNGYRNEMAFSTRDKIGVCILTNAPTDFAAKSVPEFFDLYYEYKDDIEHWNDLLL